MAPDVDRLIVKHEQGLADLTRAIEVDTVPPRDELIVYQMRGSIFNVTDKGLELDLPQVPHFLQFVHVFIRRL